MNGRLGNDLLSPIEHCCLVDCRLVEVELIARSCVVGRVEVVGSWVFHDDDVESVDNDLIAVDDTILILRCCCCNSRREANVD